MSKKRTWYDVERTINELHKKWFAAPLIITAFRLLLGFAKSPTDLANLHSRLPEDRRLMNDDLRLLKERFIALNGAEARQKRPSDDEVLTMVNEAFDDHTLSQYYWWKIRRGLPKVKTPNGVGGCYCRLLRGYSLDPVDALFTYSFKAGCSLMLRGIEIPGDEDRVWMELWMTSEYFKESDAFFFLRQSPKANAFHVFDCEDSSFCHHSGRGRFINVLYPVDKTSVDGFMNRKEYLEYPITFYQWDPERATNEVVLPFLANFAGLDGHGQLFSEVADGVMSGTVFNHLYNRFPA